MLGFAILRLRVQGFSVWPIKVHGLRVFMCSSLGAAGRIPTAIKNHDLVVGTSCPACGSRELSNRMSRIRGISRSPQAPNRPM